LAGAVVDAALGVIANPFGAQGPVGEAACFDLGR
jgi:hypothetical protein